MIHLLIGDGKGKTTSAAGMAIRAVGQCMSVLFVQFLKDGTSGEVNILKGIEGISFECMPENNGFLFQMNKVQYEKTIEQVKQLFDIAIRSSDDLIILDEILHVIELVEKEKVVRLLEHRGEIVMTGTSAPQWIIDKADYISRICNIKHPYERGVQARRGIEF